MADVTTAIGGLPPGAALPTMGLTTSEKEYEFTKTAGSRNLRAVQMMAEAEWQYTHATGGALFIVPANVPITIDVYKTPQSVFAKATAGTATLRLMMAD